MFALIALPVATLGAQDRVMIGDNIYVGPNEDIGEAVCIGCSIHIEGKVEKAVAIGGSVRIAGEVEHEAVAVGGSIDVAGKVGQEAVAVGGSLDISGEVEHDAVAVLGRIRLEPGARIGHDAVSVLGGVQGLDQATVGGSIHESGGIRPVALSGIVILLIVVAILAVAVWPIVTLIAISALGPRRVAVLHETISRRAGMCFLLGVGTWLASIFLPIVLFWLPPADFIIGVAFFVVAAIGYAGVSYWVGLGLVKSRSMAATGVVGAILVTIIQFIPVVGWFIATPVFGFLALGAAVLSGFGTSVDWMLQRSEVDPMPRPAVR
jgi:hypothetical protein